MDDVPDIVDIIGNAFNQERPLYDVAADLGALILAMEHEKKCYGEHTKSMAELKKLADVQDRVFTRTLARDVEKSDHQKKPHLTIIK
jgi:hypothetical protein